MTLPKHVCIFALDHSPWANATLLALWLRRVPCEIFTAPPPGVFWNSGVLTPCASFDGGPWQHESWTLIRRLGFFGGTKAEVQNMNHAMIGVIHRGDNLWRFYSEWSKVKQHHAVLLMRLIQSAQKSFAVLYYASILKKALTQNWMSSTRKPEQAHGYLYWERALEELEKSGTGPFFGGSEVNVVDIELFGTVQCHCSMPWVPAVKALREDPKLHRMRAWIGKMHELCKGYPHCYSGSFFEPNIPTPDPSTLLERAAFWLGSGATLVAFPFTLPMVAYYFKHVRETRRKTFGVPEEHESAETVQHQSKL